MMSAPGVQNAVRLIGGDAHHGGVFAVDHRKVRMILPLHLPQIPADLLQARIAYHIANRQYPKVHSCLHT